MRNTPPFVKILPLVIVGIVVGGELNLCWWVVAIGAALCSLCGYLLRPRWAKQTYIVVAIVLWATSSTLLHKPVTATQPHSIVEEVAVVTSTPYHNGGRWRRADATLWLNDKPHNVLLRADTTLSIALGERASLNGYLVPLPEGSYGSLMARRGYYGTLYISHPADWQMVDTLSSPRIGAQRVQSALCERIGRLQLSPNEEAIVNAMLLGNRSGITSSLRDTYSRAGTSHLLAISGLHVGLVAMGVWWLCWLFPALGRRGHIWRNVVASAVMILYAILTGLSPSVVRATLMFCAAQAALAYGTSRQSVNILCGVGALMLLANPNNLYDISFQLSMVAVVGIAVGYGPLSAWLGGNSPKRWLRWLVGVVVVALCSTIATLPLVSHTFGTISLVGIFLNPIVILTAEIIVMGGFIWVSLPLEVLTSAMRWIVGGAAQLQNMLTHEAASLPWAAMEVTLPAWVVGLCYLLMGAGVVVAALWKDRKQWNIKS